ncbi:TPA: hypothetical protein I7707_20040 [Vibrio vulnificus]|uniref:hypothetical protein n=1 Tax=Vibrio vulnificus TaxID=672 RepID=UPI000541FAE3|nr:hypothetical protein [Vibrio vulnificus]KHF82330.1 hypothetical protein OA19_20180 [Vibrio vulnificus]KHF82853.1 hypothetical protein OA16_20735 [Vibrio vulnificus]MCG6272956.1 hypothetical protein [Vibrio vulnificus]HAS8290997.1 hypothetical protein [Vibrio vulnificus]HAS8335547.1 hypothetical protein [Vibrio vulnificus]
MTFFKVKITQEMIESAIARALDLPKYDKNFKQYIQEEGDGEITAKVDGIIGERVAEIWLQANGFNYIDCRNQTTHDYLVESRIKLEVKAKRRTVIPKLEYEATVPQYVHDIQKPTAYLFVSHHLRSGRDYDFSRYIDSYVVGGISRKRFDPLKRAIVEGELDPSNNWICTEACYNISISQLFNPREYAQKFTQFLKV